MQPEKLSPARRRELEQQQSKLVASLLEKAKTLAQRLSPEELQALEKSSPTLHQLVVLEMEATKR